MLNATYPYYLANKPVAANTDLEVTNKYTGEVATRVAMADADAIDEAIHAADAAAEAMRKFPSYKRAEVLHHVARRMKDRHEELSKALCIEAGKPIKDSRGEVSRGVDTFTIAAEEAVRIYGEYNPLDISARAEGYESIWKRVPIGVCSFISPFNFPINLAAHKVAPAIAAGCPFVLKPASKTPIGAIIMGEILAETDLPAGAFSILPCRRDGADLFTTDERFKLLSFTGSPDVGWALKAKAGKKPVILELGGNAACIVDKDADLDYAAQRMMIGAFYQSGQSCIGVQRVIIHDSIYEPFKQKLAAMAAALKVGDPLDEDTFVGPLIDEREAIRLEQWTNEAVERGAKVLCGGQRNGAFYDATFIENAPKDAAITCREAFGPVATVEPFSSFKQACDIVNDSVFGLQAGVFTNSMQNAFYAFNELDVGGVVINDIPSFRVDSMPYGGVKDSGLGREGIRFAIEDMTEKRLMVLNRIGQTPD